MTTPLREHTEKFFERVTEIVASEREEQHGTPLVNHGCAVGMWNAYLKARQHYGATEITMQDYEVMMILMKVSRIACTPEHVDSWLDIAGYANIGAFTLGPMKETHEPKPDDESSR